MNETFVEALYGTIVALCGFCVLFGVCGILADYVLPRIPFLRRWADGLNLFPGDNAEPSDQE